MADLTPEQINALQRVRNGLVSWNGSSYDIGEAFDSLVRYTSTDEHRQAWDAGVQVIFARALTSGWIQRSGTVVSLTDTGRTAYISGRTDD